MKILVLQTDKTQDSYIAEGIDIYLKRLKNYTQLDIHTINVPKTLRQRGKTEQQAGEAPLILKQINTEDFLVLLDENGTEFSSQGFADFIAKKQVASLKRVVFLIGGPYGFHPTVYDRANFQLSLSRMTFSHQMVRLFFLEQLYRAYTIIKGEKYHHA
jgi:23S rRNA (pseudouridine1915-N3)-methyltransferase